MTTYIRKLTQVFKGERKSDRQMHIVNNGAKNEGKMTPLLTLLFMYTMYIHTYLKTPRSSVQHYYVCMYLLTWISIQRLLLLPAKGYFFFEGGPAEILQTDPQGIWLLLLLALLYIRLHTSRSQQKLSKQAVLKLKMNNWSIDCTNYNSLFNFQMQALFYACNNHVVT